MNLPETRPDLLVQDLNDEVLIYDQNTGKSYCLNSTARAVFNHCDGVKTFADVNLPEDIIYLSLDELKKNDLIQSVYSSPFTGINRREVVRKVGLASMVALPIISVLVAPLAAQAASQTFAAGSRTLNQSCNTSTDCNQANAPDCVAVRGQSNTGRACCQSGTSQPVFLTGGDPNGGARVNYTSQTNCQNAVAPQCCSRAATCTCTANGNGSVSCTTV